MNYLFLNKLLSKSFPRFFPKTINRKLFRRYSIFFVPTNLNRLPKSYYPVFTNLKIQELIIYLIQKLIHIIIIMLCHKNNLLVF